MNVKETDIPEDVKKWSLDLADLIFGDLGQPTDEENRNRVSNWIAHAMLLYHQIQENKDGR